MLSHTGVNPRHLTCFEINQSLLQSGGGSRRFFLFLRFFRLKSSSVQQQALILRQREEWPDNRPEILWTDTGRPNAWPVVQRTQESQFPNIWQQGYIRYIPFFKKYKWFICGICPPIQLIFRGGKMGPGFSARGGISSLQLIIYPRLYQSKYLDWVAE